MLSCIPEPSDVGIQQWLWSWLSAWQTLTTLLSNKLIGPGNYGSILPNTCTMPMPRWAHKLLFSTPRILLALWFLLFFPKYIERPESCLGSYLCLWQQNENSCCLGISHSSVLGVHIWIKEKCFVKEKKLLWMSGDLLPVLHHSSESWVGTHWLAHRAWGAWGVDNARDTSLW